MQHSKPASLLDQLPQVIVYVVTHSLALAFVGAMLIADQITNYLWKQK